MTGCGVVVAIPKNALRAFSNESSGIGFPHFGFSLLRSVSAACNVFPEDKAAICFTELKRNHNDASDERLYNCVQFCALTSLGIELRARGQPDQVKAKNINYLM